MFLKLCISVILHLLCSGYDVCVFDADTTNIVLLYMSQCMYVYETSVHVQYVWIITMKIIINFS